MLFDTHAHYDDEQFEPDRDGVLCALAGAGVGLVVNPSVTAENAARVLALAERYPFLYAAVGVHPENCGHYDGAELAHIRALAAHPKCVAIGMSYLAKVVSAIPMIFMMNHPCRVSSELSCAWR